MPDIGLGGLINFLLGLAFGFVLFAVLYTYLLVRGSRQTFEATKPQEQVDKEDIEALIKDKQSSFKRLYKGQDRGYSRTIYDLSHELVEEISKYYFPKSKYPMLELSVNEMLNLSHYITDRVDKLLEQPLLKNTRNVRVSHMAALYDHKKRLEDKKIYKAVTNKKLRKGFKLTLGAINLFNPAYWFRKLVVKTSVDFVSMRIAYMIIAIVGEETSNIYSKKLFDRDMDFNLVEQELEALEKGEDEDTADD